MAWHRCTPALPKPIPANDAASLKKLPSDENRAVRASSAQHLLLGLAVLGVPGNTWQVLDSLAECPCREHVCDRVRALVCGTELRVRRAGAALCVPGKPC
jgi:hypothetical protein